jgi:hypothetical protein
MTNTDMLNRLKAGKATTQAFAYAAVEPQIMLNENPNREGFFITNNNNAADLEVIFYAVANEGDALPPTLPTTPAIIIPPMSMYESGLVVFTGYLLGAYTQASGTNDAGFNVTELSK